MDVSLLGMLGLSVGVEEVHHHKQTGMDVRFLIGLLPMPCQAQDKEL